MSLLLDALKRAEQEKHARGERSPAAREPVAPPPHATESLTLQPIAAATPAARTEGGPAPQAQAQAMFQAKAAVAASDGGRQHRGMLWAVLGAVLVITLGAGAYVWMQLQALTPKSPSAQGAVMATRPPPAPTPAPASLAPATPPPVSPTALVTPATVAAVPEPAAKPMAPPRPAPTRESLARELAEERAASAAPEPLQFSRNDTAARVHPGVASGYQALREGDLAAARRAYEGTLAADPRNLDALLGAATVEAQQGRRAAAAGLYRRALEVDPRNATALAGMAALSDYTRPDRLEIQLREDLARTPGSATLHLALGNVFASQSRWNDAQVEYFEAHRLEPANGDIAHNLAVSLDQLGKGRAAAEFYRRALEGSGGRFDREQVSRRLAELSGAR